MTVLVPCIEHEDRDRGVFAQARGQNAARRTGSHDDVVELLHLASRLSIARRGGDREPPSELPDEQLVSVRVVAVRFAIIGGGPAGVEAASNAARLGVDVTLVEREVIGGAANLWDCIPSKAMIATGALRSLAGRAEAVGVSIGDASVDLKKARFRVHDISERPSGSMTFRQLDSQGCASLARHGALVGPHAIEYTPGEETPSTPTEVIEADAILLATGSAPRVPEVGGGRRRRPHPRDATGLSARDLAPAPRHRRIGCHRRRVRAHVRVVRIRGDAPRFSPAGAADEGS